jgi:ferredoxin
MPDSIPLTCAIHIDVTVCRGTGMCVSVSPSHFRLNGEKAEPVGSPAALDESLLEATEMCPTSAITLLGPDGEIVASG